MEELIQRVSGDDARPSSDQLRRATRALLECHGVHPDAHVFGAAKEPLLHSLARRGLLHLVATLREAFSDVDVEQANAAGETPLALALAAHMPFKNKHVLDRVVKAIGGRLDALPTIRTIATHCMRADDLCSLVTLVNAGMTADRTQVPLVHLCARHCTNPYAATFLIDHMGQDPLERDAQGRVVLQLPGLGSAAFRAQLEDTTSHYTSWRIALLMGVHPRLGARSPLRLLSGELLREFFIIPHTMQHPVHCRGIEGTREMRLKALETDEGVQISFSMRIDYTVLAGDLTLADIRRAHFLATTKGLLANLPREVKRSRPDTREALTARLTALGFRFDEPYSADYAARAAAALRAYRP